MNIVSKPFDNKVAYVTGAGTGIGAEIAKTLAGRGAAVALVGRGEASLRDIEAQITSDGGTAITLPADISDEAAVERTIAQTIDRFGAVHLAVNNAGIPGDNRAVGDLDAERWTEIIGVNLSGVYLCMKHEIKAMEKAGGGSIVNVSSVFADRGLVGRSAYSASKHGLRGLTRSAAIEYARRGIRINEIQPGVIAVARQNSNADEVGKIAERIPLGRLGHGAEIATAVCFLLSNDASYVTGAHLAVDGGFLS
jgi:NAD(P)-dependent dehydrogenase (short-subunit alcohol dehydrogenase family)